MKQRKTYARNVLCGDKKVYMELYATYNYVQLNIVAYKAAVMDFLRSCY